MIFDLVKDFADVLDAMPKDHPRHRILKLLDEAICRDVHFIDRHPTTLFQCLWNTCWWYDCEERTEHFDAERSLHQCGVATESANAPVLSQLMEGWRNLRGSHSPPWLRSLRPPQTPLAGNLIGGLTGDGIACIAVDRVGDRLFLGTANAEIVEWDLVTHKSVFHATSHRRTITALACSADGRYLVSGDDDGEIQVWKLATMESTKADMSHARSVTSLRFLVEHTDCFASGSMDETIRIWNVRTASAVAERGNLHRTGTGQQQINGLAVRPRIRPNRPRPKPGPFTRANPDHLAVLSTRSRCLVFEQSQLGRDDWLYDCHNEYASAIATGYDPTLSTAICIGYEDGLIGLRLWLAQEHAVQFRIPHGEPTCLEFSADGRLACGSDHGEITIWNPWNQQLLMTLSGHSSDIMDLVFLAERNWLISLAFGECRIWNLSPTSVPEARLDHASDAITIQFSRDGQRVMSRDTAGEAIAWDSATGVGSFLNTSLAEGTRVYALSLDGTEFAAGDADGMLSRWSLDDPHNIDAHPFDGAIHAAAYSPDGRHLAVSAGKIVGVWRMSDWKQVFQLAGHTTGARVIEFSPDGRFACSASDNSLLHEIPIEQSSDSTCRTLSGHDLGRRSRDRWWNSFKMHFTADGKSLVVWDVPSSYAETDSYLNGYKLSHRMRIRSIPVDDLSQTQREGGSGKFSDSSKESCRDYEIPLFVDLRYQLSDASNASWMLRSRYDGTSVGLNTNDVEAAWLPGVYVIIATHPTQNIWMVGSGRFIDIFALEDDDGSDDERLS